MKKNERIEVKLASYAEFETPAVELWVDRHCVAEMVFEGDDPAAPISVEFTKYFKESSIGLDELLQALHDGRQKLCE